VIAPVEAAATVHPWPRFMTARVAARYSATSPWTVRRHVRACGRRGRLLVYAIEDVDQWMRGEPIERVAPEIVPIGNRAAPSTSEIALARIRALGARPDAVAGVKAACNAGRANGEPTTGQTQ
jgi:hypothetical protein